MYLTGTCSLSTVLRWYILCIRYVIRDPAVYSYKYQILYHGTTLAELFLYHPLK